MTIIELNKVSKQYPGCDQSAADDISFKLEKGEIMALLGPSGSGKTTILRLIAGFESVDAGQLKLNGVEVSRPGYHVPPEKRGIGMVFQDYALFPHLTVVKNVAFGLRHLSASARKKKVNDLLALSGLSDLSARYPHELSGGQQQRVALIRALAPDPAVVMLDEPFSHLDPDMALQMREEVVDILRTLNSTAILVTHDHVEAFTMADKIALLNGGRLEQFDTPEGIYHTPVSPFAAKFVGQADFIRGLVQADKILTEIGCLENSTGYGEGAEVRVLIRPDDIDLQKHDAKAHDQGKATVLARQFRGSENLYTLKLASGQIVHSSQHSLEVYDKNTEVDLSLKLTHTVAFDPEK